MSMAMTIFTSAATGSLITAIVQPVVPKVWDAATTGRRHRARMKRAEQDLLELPRFMRLQPINGWEFEYENDDLGYRVRLSRQEGDAIPVVVHFRRLAEVTKFLVAKEMARVSPTTSERERLVRDTQVLGRLMRGRAWQPDDNAARHRVEALLQGLGMRLVESEVGLFVAAVADVTSVQATRSRARDRWLSLLRRPLR